MKISTILLVEDNPNDVELILSSLKEFRLANSIDVVYDGVEAMEYLRSEGKFKKRKPEHPSVVLLDIKMQGWMELKFWKQYGKIRILNSFRLSCLHLQGKTRIY
jgi:CheY-like chemotaxis protein